MNLGFQLGVICGSFLLINFHLLIAMIIAVIFTNLFNLEMMAAIPTVAYLLITGIGHARCSFNVFTQVLNPNLFNKPLPENETINEAMNPKNNHLILGVVWRITNEWIYIKKTANLDFKSKD